MVTDYPTSAKPMNSIYGGGDKNAALGINSYGSTTQPFSRERLLKLLYPEEKDRQREEETRQRLSAKARDYIINPFLRRDGSLANPYLDYQSIIDRPGTSSRLAENITQATGIKRTSTETAGSANVVSQAASGDPSPPGQSSQGSSNSSFGTSGSGEKATYNTNFSASKTGAENVNKNSPFASYSITSYTGARNTGINGASADHAGVDRAVPEGTKISLPIGTTFYRSGSDSARGNWIEVKDQNGNIMHYQHLQSFATGYKPGDKISAGTAFAVSGSTGVGKAHLHEEYYTPDGKTNITESYWNNYAPKWNYPSKS